MAVSKQLRTEMQRDDLAFEPIEHMRTFDMARAAHAAHVSGRNVAKAVVVKEQDHCFLAVLPASKRIDMISLGKLLGNSATLASEEEAAARFPDCEFGAIPPLGAAYGLDMMVDDDLLETDEVYFEGGDHRTLVAVNGATWRRLMKDARHASFSKDA